MIRVLLGPYLGVCHVSWSGQSFQASGPFMESIVVLIADRISMKDMLKLHELSPTASGALKIWPDVQILDSLDDQIWADMSEE